MEGLTPGESTLRRLLVKFMDPENERKGVKKRGLVVAGRTKGTGRVGGGPKPVTTLGPFGRTPDRSFYYLNPETK